MKEIPQKIWFLWLQGYSDAPLIVKQCFRSWQIHNPDWEIVFLSEQNLEAYSTLKLEQWRTLSKQQLSDLIRLDVLSRYGGVWVDATCFCVQPLRCWLGDYTETGFFAFYKPAKDRLLSSWFLASEKEGPIVTKLGKALKIYWTHSPSNQRTGKYPYFFIKNLQKTLGRDAYTTRFWFSPIITKFLGLVPYFAIHYQFAELVRTDPECRAIWSKTRKLSADIPHKIRHAGLFSPLSPEMKVEIDSKTAPLYKLRWKHNPDEIQPGCNLHYLLETLE
jgi:hypothetical protein